MLIIAVVIIFIIIIFLSSFFSNNQAYTKQRNEELEKYLTLIGDKNFFCYNNRKDAQDFIEKELLPNLDKRIEFIYLDGKDPLSNYAKVHISWALHSLKNYKRFPHLLKVRNGQMIDQSINNEFYNTVNQNKPMDKLLEEINAFFQLKEENKTEE